jgi:hypothetical protein
MHALSKEKPRIPEIAEAIGMEIKKGIVYSHYKTL